MSEATRKLRSIEAHTTSVCGVRDLAADAIDAVEAQVAAQAKRHEDLAAWCAETEARVEKLSACVTATDDSLSDWAERHEKVLDRLAALEKRPTIKCVMCDGPHDVADHPDVFDPPKPAPSAFAAPRGFKKGDVVRTGGLSPFDAVVVEVYEPQSEGLNVTIKADRGTYKWHGPDLTLVRAADAPEAPAEEDTGLVVQRIRDEATKPLHVEIEKLRGEVARLTKERDEARAISAATAERVRNETQIATELRKDLADAKREASVWKRECEMFSKAWSRELGPRRPKSHLIDELVVGTKDLVAERDALRAELDEAKKWRDEFKRIGQAAEAELNALKAKPRFRTRKVRAKDAEAFDKEYYKREYAAGYEDYARAMNAVGLRRRVEQSK